jgi:hypothetical protein
MRSIGGLPFTTPGTSVRMAYVSTDADEMVKSVTTSPEQIAVSVDWPPLTLRFRNPPETWTLLEMYSCWLGTFPIL